MLEGKELILATRKFAKEDRSRSWFLFGTTLLILILSLVGTLINFHIILQIMCSIFSGLMMVRFFVIYHDYLHKAILQKSRFADIIFKFFGMYVLAPKTVWERSHNYHHKHNCKYFKLVIGSYPVYTREKFDSLSPRERFGYLFIRHPLTIAFGYIFIFMYGMCIDSLRSGFRRHLDSLFALILHFTIQICLFYFGGWEAYLLFGLIPHLVSGALGAYLFYAQHNFPGVYFADDGEWTYELSALKSSSFMKLSPFMHWATANIGYHHIHHLNARIPFYRLPEAFAYFKELQHPLTTSLKIKDIIACFRLKVWDREKGRMVSLQGN